MDDDAKKLESFDIRRLYQLLPHRYPFLMVDRIIDVDGDNSAIGIKNVTPTSRTLPGTSRATRSCRACSSIEGMAQTAGAICVAARAPVPPRTSSTS